MGKKTRRDEIPESVREYMTAADGLGHFAVQQRHPDLEQVLHSPGTRQTLLRYLSSREAWQDTSVNFTMNILAFLLGNATLSEAPIVRPFLRHPHAGVRLRAYQYLMGVYYPARDRGAIDPLLKDMAADPDAAIRDQAETWRKGFTYR